MRWRELPLVAAAAALCCAGLHAAEFTKEDAQEMVKRLSSHDFKVRQAATEELQELIIENPEAEKLFEPYKNHPDPEVRTRLREGMVRICREARWWSPSLEGRIRSPDDKLPREVKLVNDSNQPVLIFWLDMDGNRQPWSIRTVEPGQTRTCRISYVGHAWLFTDADGEALGIFTLGPKTDEVRFTKPIK